MRWVLESAFSSPIIYLCVIREFVGIVSDAITVRILSLGWIVGERVFVVTHTILFAVYSSFVIIGEGVRIISNAIAVTFLGFI